MPMLLSPAGSPEALRAAIDNGADEVYLGGNAFNARINASNFDSSALIRAGETCRRANVGLLITLNTLIYDKEFPSVLEYVSFLDENVHPDGLIVQDFGLVRVLREKFPHIPLHASTQMRIHSYADGELLRVLGFTRAVLARELPKEDISAFVKTGLETEIFVHGAICVSESGGCLMSSVIGNRSGNRGECAQPCRLPYKGNNKYPLSLKDMCLAGHIKELCEMNITSLKIEGRMKAPDYVGAVTSVYRKLIDEKRNATPEEIKYLNQIFSRSGSTDGYFVSKINSGMFGIRSEADKKLSRISAPPAGKAVKREGYVCTKPSAVTQFPEKDIESILHPAKQKGLVLRFEGRLPSEGFLKRYAPAAARIDVPLTCCTDKRFAPYADKVSAILPRNIFLNEMETVKQWLKSVYDMGIRHATVSSLYQVEMCKGFYIHGDYSFNVVNREALAFLENYSFSSIMLSPETDGKFPKGSRCALEYIGYGRTPLMHTRTCIIRNISGCKNAKHCHETLIDRTGAKFPVISGHNHRNTIYNSIPAYRLDRKAELKRCGVGLLTLLFTDETEARMAEVIALAETKGKPMFDYTRR